MKDAVYVGIGRKARKAADFSRRNERATKEERGMNVSSHR
jgi:hypothetical protein